MLTRNLFLGLIVLIFLQRLIELRISQRNVAAILSKGGQIHGENLLPWVKVLQLSWFLAMIAEVWGFNRPFNPLLASFGVIGLLSGQVLRFLSMKALGWRWSLPIATVPGLPTVNTGIYRYLRHPNWLGVIIEIAALPLIHSAYLAAIGFSVVNALILRQRVQQEETALAETANDRGLFLDTPRFLPKLSIWSLRGESPL
jgi:methyltransferase